MCSSLTSRSATIGRDELLDGVWGRDATPTARAVDIRVAWLRRRKLGGGRPRFILTVQGVGYKFDG